MCAVASFAPPRRPPAALRAAPPVPRNPAPVASISRPSGLGTNLLAHSDLRAPPPPARPRTPSRALPGRPLARQGALMSPRRRFALLSLVLTLLVTPSIAAVAGPPGGGKGAEGAAPAAPDKPFQDWKKLTKDAEVMKGYFTIYRKRENLYLELKPAQLNQPVLGIFSFARGIGSNFLLGGLPLGEYVLEFQRAGDHVLVIDHNTRFVASGDSAYSRAVDLSI